MNIDEFVFVRNYIVTELGKTGQDYTHTQIACAMVDFDNLFPDGVSAMYRFINWMKTHGYTEHEILPALSHDLSGMHDDGFSPKVSSY
jgi:hypothetical protein